MSGGLFDSPDKDGDFDALCEYLRAQFSGDNLPENPEGEMNPLFVDDIVKKFAELQPDTKDWLVGLDPDFAPISRGQGAFSSFPGEVESKYRSYNSSYSGKAVNQKFPTPDLPKEETAAGLAFFNCLKTGVGDRADKITVSYGTPAKSLIKNEEGEIVGVVAMQGDAEIRVKASKGVVISTGGYEYSEGMRRSFLEGPGITGWAFYGGLNSEGDGIRMATEVGAQLTKVSKVAARLIWACPDVTKNGMKVGANCDVVGTEGTIVVDAHGRRFMDETLITTDPSRYFSYKNATKMDVGTLQYPNIPSYLIVDETKRLAGSLLNLTFSTSAFGVIPWDEKNQTGIDKGWLIKADTIEELAEKIRDEHDLNLGRMDPAVLVETMQKYQQMVDTGVDEEFGRSCIIKDPITEEETNPGFQPIVTPPFYALPLVPGGPNSLGGLMADGDRHVVNWSNEIIPRLYAAGEVASVFLNVTQGGGNITECVVSGRIAGANAAAEAAWDAEN